MFGGTSVRGSRALPLLTLLASIVIGAGAAGGEGVAFAQAGAAPPSGARGGSATGRPTSGQSASAAPSAGGGSAPSPDTSLAPSTQPSGTGSGSSAAGAGSPSTAPSLMPSGDAPAQGSQPAPAGANGAPPRVRAGAASDHAGRAARRHHDPDRPAGRSAQARRPRRRAPLRCRRGRVASRPGVQRGLVGPHAPAPRAARLLPHPRRGLPQLHPRPARLPRPGRQPEPVEAADRSILRHDHRPGERDQALLQLAELHQLHRQDAVLGEPALPREPRAAHLGQSADPFADRHARQPGARLDAGLLRDGSGWHCPPPATPARRSASSRPRRARPRPASTGRRTRSTSTASGPST